MNSPYAIFCFLFIIPLLGACRLSHEARLHTAYDIASKGELMERKIPARNFLLTSFERVTKTIRNASGGEANIYIEGDGLAWQDRNTPSPDPTPINPVALRLAVADPAQNVIYISRPCQYTQAVGTRVACDEKYWTDARFSSGVVDAMSLALDDIKRRHHLKNFNLIGFSGGGSIAVLLAAKRLDVLTLRTIAGNLDTDAFSKANSSSPLAASINPVSVAKIVSGIPQHHFLGADDSVIPPEGLSAFIKAAGSNRCIETTVIAGAAHETGWAEKWPRLLLDSPRCYAK